MKKTAVLLVCFLFLTPGCLDVAPKADRLADIKAELKAELHNEFKAEIMTELTAEVKTNVSAELKNSLSVELENNLSARLSAQLSNSIKNEMSARLSNEIDTKIASSIQNDIVTKLTNQVKGDLNSMIQTSVNAKGAELNTKMAAVESSVKNDFQQKFNTLKGEVNNGSFSGGGVYVTIVAVVLIVCLFSLAGYFLFQLTRWKTAFHQLNATFNEFGQQQPDAFVNAKKQLKNRFLSNGLARMIDQLPNAKD